MENEEYAKPDIDVLREKLQRLGEEGNMIKEEFVKMKQELEVEYLATSKKKEKKKRKKKKTLVNGKKRIAQVDSGGFWSLVTRSVCNPSSQQTVKFSKVMMLALSCWQ